MAKIPKVECLRKKINLYSVFTFLKYGPSELYSYSVSDQYKFYLPLQQVLNKGLDTTSSLSSQSETEHQTVSEVTMRMSNSSTVTSEVTKSYGLEDFQSEMETRRELKKKVCERSNKADRALLSPLMEKVVYYV